MRTLIRSLALGLLLPAAALAQPQPPLPAPSSCSVSTIGLQNTVTWTAVPGAAVYSVEINGWPGYSISPPTTTLVDTTMMAGVHEYCIRAWSGTSPGPDDCCSTATNVATLATPVCWTSQLEFGQVAFHWTAVPGATAYRVLKDYYTIDIVPAGETTWVDHVFETHKYCVQALSADAGSDTSCAFGPGVNFAGHSQLSWEVCAPQVWNQTFNGPGTYHLVVTVQGVSSANVGHHTELVIQRPGIPDAWRFDDGGCQGLSRVHADAVAVTGCPPMLGANPVATMSSSYDGSLYGSIGIRLDMSYGPFLPDPNTQYVLWRIAFDHSKSIAGTDSDPATCDGASEPMGFTARSQIVGADGVSLDATNEGPPVRWQGFDPVRTQPATWGRIKAMYH